MIYLDDTIFVQGEPCTGGSRILEGFHAPFDAAVVEKLKAAGEPFALRVSPAEFGHGRVDCDLLPRLVVESCGAYGRAALPAGKVLLKPTYGSVSRYGILPVACSGEQVSVLADTVAEARKYLAIITGHDDRDGTSLPDPTWKRAGEQPLRLCGEGLPAPQLSKAVWYVLYSAEACNNLSRYDGVKFGYRSPNYRNIEELYTNTRTEGFTFANKQVILYGSDLLSRDRYVRYEQAMKVRRVLWQRLHSLLQGCDALVCQDAYLPLLTGFPSITVRGKQFIAPPLGEETLLRLAEQVERGELQV